MLYSTKLVKMVTYMDSLFEEMDQISPIYSLQMIVCYFVDPPWRSVRRYNRF